jgi:CRP-like cAMP-binding protein/rhodanese-related sulfurtransferase
MSDDNEKDQRLLTRTLIEDIPPEKLQELMDAVENRTIPAHTLIFGQGDPGDSFYIINSGRVKVFKKDVRGLETDFAVMGPGESFGEMSLLTGEPRSASVETLADTNLYIVPKEKFDQILEDYPQISMKFIRQMSSWLLRDEERLMKEKQRLSGKPEMSLVDFIIIGVLSLLFGIIFNQSNPNGIPLIPDFLSKEEAAYIAPSADIAEKAGDAYLILDARPANFYDERHIKGAENMPFALFDIMYLMLAPRIQNAEQVIIYGRTISRRYDELVFRKLQLNGHRNIKILEGGMRAWGKSGLQLEP